MEKHYFLLSGFYAHLNMTLFIEGVLNLFSFIIHCTWKDEYSQHKTNIGLGQIKN